MRIPAKVNTNSSVSEHLKAASQEHLKTGHIG